MYSVKLPTKLLQRTVNKHECCQRPYCVMKLKFGIVRALEAVYVRFLRAVARNCTSRRFRLIVCDQSSARNSIYCSLYVVLILPGTSTEECRHHLPCLNGGRCIFGHPFPSSTEKVFACACSNGHTGTYCETGKCA